MCWVFIRLLKQNHPTPVESHWTWICSKNETLPKSQVFSCFSWLLSIESISIDRQHIQYASDSLTATLMFLLLLRCIRNNKLYVGTCRCQSNFVSVYVMINTIHMHLPIYFVECRVRQRFSKWILRRKKNYVRHVGVAVCVCRVWDEMSNR